MEFPNFTFFVPNRHFRRVAFWSKTAILRDSQRWADGVQIFAHRNYDGCLNFHFCVLRDLGGLKFRIATSYESPFCTGTDILRDRWSWADRSLIFAHRNYDGFLNFHFALFARFWKTNFTISTSGESHCWAKTAIPTRGRRWADFSLISVLRNYEGS